MRGSPLEPPSASATAPVAAAPPRAPPSTGECTRRASYAPGPAPASGTRDSNTPPTAVGRCRLTVLNPVLKAPTVSALVSGISKTAVDVSVRFHRAPQHHGGNARGGKRMRVTGMLLGTFDHEDDAARAAGPCRHYRFQLIHTVCCPVCPFTRKRRVTSYVISILSSPISILSSQGHIPHRYCHPPYRYILLLSS